MGFVKIAEYVLGIVLGILNYFSRKRDERLGQLEAQNDSLQQQADRAKGRAEINAEVRRESPDDLERDLAGGV